MKLNDIINLYKNMDSTDVILIFLVMVILIFVICSSSIKRWIRMYIYNEGYKKLINKRGKIYNSKDCKDIIGKIENYYKDNKESKKVDKNLANVISNSIVSVDIVNCFALIFTILITIYTIYFSLTTNVRTQQIFTYYQNINSISTEITKEMSGSDNQKIINNLRNTRDKQIEEVKEISENLKNDLSPHDVFFQYLKLLFAFTITVGVIQYYMNLSNNIKKSFYLLCIEIIEDIEKDEERYELKKVLGDINKVFQVSEEVAIAKSKNEYIEKGKIYKIILEKYK